MKPRYIEVPRRPVLWDYRGRGLPTDVLTCMTRRVRVHILRLYDEGSRQFHLVYYRTLPNGRTFRLVCCVAVEAMVDALRPDFTHQLARLTWDEGQWRMKCRRRAKYPACRLKISGTSSTS